MTASINASLTAGVVVSSDTSGSLALQTAGTSAVTINSSQVVSLANPLAISSGGTGATSLAGANIATTTSSTQSINSANTFGFKNRIINGGMVIDQRNAGASVTPGAGYYTLDRWLFYVSQASKFTTQQTPSSTETGYATRVAAGFTNYLACTSSSAYSLGAGDQFFLAQKIEGFNFADLAWGTSNAKTCTLSFLVYSSLTGTFGGSLQNAALNRCYPFSYTIPTANTWTQISVTIQGDTTGTWIGATNGVGLNVNFSLGTGTSYSATAGVWNSTSYVTSVTGAVSVVGTSGATWYVTGVQFEVGSQATSFDFRDYGRELILCQRYFTTFLGNNAYERAGFGLAIGTASASIGLSQPVAMRVIPSISYSGSLYLYNGIGFNSITSFTTDSPAINYSTIVANVASGLVSGSAYQLISANNTTARVTLNSEL